MRANQLTPSELADDLFISASRDNHANIATTGMQLSRTYFHDIWGEGRRQQVLPSHYLPNHKAETKEVNMGHQRNPT